MIRELSAAILFLGFSISASANVILIDYTEQTTQALSTRNPGPIESVVPQFKTGAFKFDLAFNSVKSGRGLHDFDALTDRLEFNLELLSSTAFGQQNNIANPSAFGGKFVINQMYDNGVSPNPVPRIIAYFSSWIQYQSEHNEGDVYTIMRYDLSLYKEVAVEGIELFDDFLTWRETEALAFIADMGVWQLREQYWSSSEQYADTLSGNLITLKGNAKLATNSVPSPSPLLLLLGSPLGLLTLRCWKRCLSN